MLERRDEYENNIFLQLQPERYVEGVAEEIYYKFINPERTENRRFIIYFLILFLSLWKGEWKTIHSLRKKKVYEWIVFPSPFPPYHLVHSALSADTKGMIVVSDRSEPREWMGMRPLSPHNLILFSAVSQGVKEVSSHSIHSQSIRFAAFGASLLCKNIIIYLYYSWNGCDSGRNRGWVTRRKDFSNPMLSSWLEKSS